VRSITINRMVSINENELREKELNPSRVHVARRWEKGRIVEEALKHCRPLCHFARRSPSTFVSICCSRAFGIYFLYRVLYREFNISQLPIHIFVAKPAHVTVCDRFLRRFWLEQRERINGRRLEARRARINWDESSAYVAFIGRVTLHYPGNAN